MLKAMASNTQKLFHCICQQYLLTTNSEKMFYLKFQSPSTFFQLNPCISRSCRYGIQLHSLLSVLAGKIRYATISVIRVYRSIGII